jgi:hypothetical protein
LCKRNNNVYCKYSCEKCFQYRSLILTFILSCRHERSFRFYSAGDKTLNPPPQTNNKKKGSPVHVAPSCAGSRDGSDHFGSYVHSLSLHFCKRLFPGLEPMRSQGNSFTTAPGLPFFYYCNNNNNSSSKCTLVFFYLISMLLLRLHVHLLISLSAARMLDPCVIHFMNHRKYDVTNLMATYFYCWPIIMHTNMHIYDAFHLS